MTISASKRSRQAGYFAGTGLFSHILVSKYADHIPLHRQEGIYRRHGLELPRSTLCDWVAQSAALGRKDWLFAGSEAGAYRAATIYSLIGSCKLCSIDPFYYLKGVLERVSHHPARPQIRRHVLGRTVTLREG